MKTCNSKDVYDIIIENALKHRSDIMIENTQKWETPRYSKSEIKKAGKILANAESSQEERDQALNILDNWRASHAYPLQVVASDLCILNPNAIVVQRLKRLESIAGKIQRYPTMDLCRMQDLGGCRVIVDTIEEVYETLDRYKKARILHIQDRDRDYIQNPQKSGYRSYHMIYQSQSDSKDTYNKNMLIEIQFRTKLQHIWATAIEMMGIYTKSNLKSSQGDEDILRFFALVSSILAIQESTPLCHNTPVTYDELVNEIKEIDQKAKIVASLTGLSNAMHSTDGFIENMVDGYFLLQLDHNRKKLEIHQYRSIDIELASLIYSQIEKQIIINKDNKNVVLVSATSFAALKAAYPNYFVDTKEFINIMKGILE